MKNFNKQMSSSDLSDILETNLFSLLELCHKLENLADNLPNDVDVQDCLMLARLIFPTLRAAHEFEESALFPALTNRFGDNEKLMATLERLRFEHWEDESFADELRESLIYFANHQEPELVNSLSYMLRGFFEGVRRHIAFEREHILPMLQ